MVKCAGYLDGAPQMMKVSLGIERPLTTKQTLKNEWQQKPTMFACVWAKKLCLNTPKTTANGQLAHFFCHRV